jgi:inner membrane protein involved in colicin E2 resistance
MNAAPIVKRIAALAFIFLCTTIAWLILGATIFSRTYSSGQSLEGKVSSSWGSQQSQAAPTASYYVDQVQPEEVQVDGRPVQKMVSRPTAIQVPLEASRVNVGVHLDPRQKGLLWYSTYAIDFSGAYTFRNDTQVEKPLSLRLNFPAEHAIYDNLLVVVDGNPAATTIDSGGVTAKVVAAPDKLVQVNFAYRSQGMSSWTYKFGDDVSKVKDFVLIMKTNFKDVDFGPDMLSPSEKQETGDGWTLTWNYNNLLSGLQIGTRMPEKLQPGPLAGQISFFAPVSLFFFFFLIFILTTLGGIDLHPMNYFFLATAFFAFHLLMAYLVDHISIHVAFLICSAVSVFLVVSYLRLVVGMRFAALEAGGAQFIYLILFSYAFFFKGFTGLAITIGSIITLFLVMQLTGRVKWGEKFEAMGGKVPVAL